MTSDERPRVPDLSCFRADPVLLDLLRDGRPALLTGRYSAESGSRTYEMSVHDLLGCVEEYEKLTGLSVAPYLPSAEELTRRLRACAPVRSKERSGRAFSNRFYELAVPEAGVYILLSSGTGKKLDDSLLQPYVTRLTAVAASINASVVFGKRWDRVSRRAWSLGPVMTLLEGSGGFIGDARRGLRKVGGVGDIEVFLTTSMGEEEAAKLPMQTRMDMRRRTADRMVDGRASFHLAGPLPPGFARIQMRSASGGKGESLMVLDDPRWHPPSEQVGYGLPDVLDASGRRVSQVENVQWALRRIGHPEWPTRLVAEGLIGRQYSTDGIRKAHGAAADVGKASMRRQPSLVVATILRNLDVYETGTMHVRLGVDGVQDVAVADCAPPEGWAEADDFSRIRAWVQASRQDKVRRRTMSLAGVPCTVNGVPARLLTSRAHRKGKPAGYVTARTDHPRSPDLPPKYTAYIPHEALAGSIVRALERLELEPLRAMTAQVDMDQDLDLTVELKAAEASLASLHQQRDGILESITSPPEGGAMAGALLRDVNRRYDALVEDEIPRAERAASTLLARLQQRRADRARALQGAAAEQVLALVSSLRDPASNRYSAVWRDAIRSLAVTKTHESRSNHGQVVTAWHAELILQGAGTQFVVPFAGSLVEGAATLLDQRVEELLRQAEAGIPVRRAAVERHGDVKYALAVRLGCDPGVFVTGKCEDPRILRVAIALLKDRERPIEDIASQLGEPDAFVRRIRSIHLDPDRRWFVWAKPNGKAVGRLLARACDQEGILRSGDHAGICRSWQYATTALARRLLTEDLLPGPPRSGIRIRPCPWCASHRRGTMRIPEPVGLTCLDCRKDSAGHAWGPEYDRWLDGREAWSRDVRAEIET